MTKKHKIRKSKHLLESKKDVDQNVENILRMIGEENEQTENEKDDSGNPLNKSKLLSLVKGFHEDYEYLHNHYKQLIGKLENVGHSSSGSNSSDSDIEGDISDNDVTTPKVALNEENSLNHKPTVGLEAEIEKLKQTTEEQAKETSNLKQLLDKAIKDKEATSVELSSEIANLSFENENLKVLLETAKREEGELLNTVKSKESEVTTLSSEKQIIQEERDNLRILIEDMEKEKEDLRNQLKDTVDKCNLLSSELEKDQQAEKEVQALLEENQKLKNDNMLLLVEHDNLKALHQNLDNECSQLKDAIEETQAENESVIIENLSAEKRLQQLGLEIDGLKVEVVELTNNLDKERSTAAEEKERLVSENSMYLNELEMAQSSVKDLESTKCVLNSNIVELQKEKNSATSEIEQLEASLTNLKTELAQQLERILAMQKTNACLELANSNLHNEIVEVQGQKNVAAASIIDLESKLEQKAQDISNLQDANKDLKTAKANLYNEVTTLQEEKNAALSQLQQSEANISNLQSDLEQLQNQILLFQQENEEVQNKNSSLHAQLEEIRTNLQGEITVLKGEKEEAINSLQKSNDLVKALGVDLEERVEQISVLQLAKEDLQNSNSNLKMQLEEQRHSLQTEILALQDEKDKILLDLHQSEASIKNLRIELEQGKEQISIMNLANEDLKNDIAILDKQLEEVRSSLHAEIAQLHAEKDTTLSELHTSHAFVRNMESVLEKQSEKISTLDQANVQLQKNVCTLTEQSEQTKVELQKEVEATKEEKDIALTKLKQSENSVQILENEVTRLKQELLVQMENNSTLDKLLEEVRSSLGAEIAQLHAEKEASLLELQISQASVRNLDIAVQTHNENISTLQQANDELQKKICTLIEQSEQTKADMQEEVKATQEMKDAMLTKLKQSKVSVQNLENEVARLKTNNTTLDKQLEEVRSNMSAEIAELQVEKEASLLELQISYDSLRDLEIALQMRNKKISSLHEANDLLEKKISTLMEQSKQAKTEFQQEIKATQEDKDEVLTQLKQSKNSIQNLENEMTRLKDELSVQQESNSTMKKQFEEVMSSMGAEIAELRAEKIASLVELETSQTFVRDLEIVLQTHNENISSLQQTNDDLQKKICTLTEQFEEAKANLRHEVNATQEEKDVVLTQLKQSEDSIQNLETEVTWLKEVRSNMGAKIAELCAEKEASLLELQTSQASVRDLEIALQTQNETISTLQQANDELYKNFCTLTEQYEQTKAELQLQIKSTHEEKDVVLTQLKHSRELIQNLENEVTRLKHDLSIQLETNSTLEKQLEEVRSSIGAEIAQLHAEKEASLLELQVSQTSIRNLDIALQTHNENISTLQQANDELNKLICTLTEQKEQTKAELQQEVKATKEEKDVVLTQLKQSEDSVQNLEKEVTWLKNELSVHLENNSILDKQLQEVRSSMGAEIAKLRGEKNASLLELQTSQASIRELKIVFQTHIENISTLQQANDELLKNICILTNQSEQVKAELQLEVKVAQEENDVVITQLKQSRDSIENLETQVARLKDELSFQLETNSTLDKQLEEVRSSMGAKIAELLAEKDASLFELHTCQTSVRDLEIALQTHNRTISTLQQANDELQKKISTLIEESEQAKAELQLEFKATQEEKDEVLTQLKQSKDLVRNLENEVARLKDELSVQLASNSTLDMQLKEVKSSMGAEIADLHAEKEASLLELQISQASVRNLDTVLQMHNENISTLMQANDELQKKICTLTEQSEQSKTDLQQVVKATHEMKDAVLTKLKQSEDLVQNLENEVARLKDELLVQLAKSTTLDKQLEEVRNNMGAEIGELYEKMEASLLELQISQASVRSRDIALQTHNENILALQQANDELQKKIYTLTEQKEQTKAELQLEVKAIKEEKDAVLTQLKESEDSVQNIGNEVTRLKDELSVQLANNTTLDKQLEEVKSSMSAKIAELHVEKEASILELKISHTSLRNLEIALQTHSESISTLHQANDELQKKICTLEEQKEQTKAELQKEVKDKQEENDAMLTQLKQSKELIENLETEMTRLKDELLVQLETNSTLDNQLGEVRCSMGAEIAELRAEKDTFLLELQTSHASIRDLEITFQTHYETIANLQQVNEELQKNICTLNKQSKQAKVELQQELKATQEEKVEVQTQLKQSRESIQNLENEVTRLKDELSVQLENISTLDKQLEEVRSSMGSKIAELFAEKEASLLELQTSQASVWDLETELQTHTENISILQQANDELHENICTLTKQLEQAKTGLQMEVKAAREENDAVLAQLKQSRESIENFETEVARLKDELSFQLETNSTKDKQLEEVRSSMSAEIAELRAKKDVFILELHTSQTSVRDLEIALETRNKNISTLKRANNELQMKISILTEQSKQAKTELLQEIMATKEEHDAMLTQLKQLEDSVQNLENEVIQLKDQLSVQLKNNSTLDKRLKKATLKMSNLSENLDDAQAEAADQIDDMSLKTKSSRRQSIYSLIKKQSRRKI